MKTFKLVRAFALGTSFSVAAPLLAACGGAAEPPASQEPVKSSDTLWGDVAPLGKGGTIRVVDLQTGEAQTLGFKTIAGGSFIGGGLALPSSFRLEITQDVDGTALTLSRDVEHYDGRHLEVSVGTTLVSRLRASQALTVADAENAVRSRLRLREGIPFDDAAMLGVDSAAFLAAAGGAAGFDSYADAVVSGSAPFGAQMAVRFIPVSTAAKAIQAGFSIYSTINDLIKTGGKSVSTADLYLELQEIKQTLAELKADIAALQQEVLKTHQDLLQMGIMNTESAVETFLDNYLALTKGLAAATDDATKAQYQAKLDSLYAEVRASQLLNEATLLTYHKVMVGEGVDSLSKLMANQVEQKSAQLRKMDDCSKLNADEDTLMEFILHKQNLQAQGFMLLTESWRNDPGNYRDIDQKRKEHDARSFAQQQKFMVDVAHYDLTSWGIVPNYGFEELFTKASGATSSMRLRFDLDRYGDQRGADAMARGATLTGPDGRVWQPTTIYSFTSGAFGDNYVTDTDGERYRHCLSGGQNSAGVAIFPNLPAGSYTARFTALSGEGVTVPVTVTAAGHFEALSFNAISAYWASQPKKLVDLVL